LNFTYCHNLTDEAILSIAPSLSGLEAIDLSGCVYMTDDGVQVQ
jgi:hypothetical protein